MTRFSAALLMLLGLPAICNAGLTFNLVENAGGQVTLTYTGSISSNALTTVNTNDETITTGLQPNAGAIEIGGSGRRFGLPTAIGSSASATSPTFGTGGLSGMTVNSGSSPVSFSFSNLTDILLPSGYSSGGTISGGATLSGSLSTLGAAVGVYTLSWSGGGTGNFITLNVVNNNTGGGGSGGGGGSSAAVPEPGTFLLGGIGSLVSGIGYRRRQRKAAAAKQSRV
jgi:hypothetical protein